MITHERLKEVLSYDQESGLFRWKAITGPRCNVGEVAGTNVHGYIRIKIDGRKYSAHRLAWLYVNGTWPKDEIDHINRNGSDNRICNLRQADRRLNVVNVGIRKDNSSGVHGVNMNNGRWVARISFHGVRHEIGKFTDKMDAALAYAIAPMLLNGDDGSSRIATYFDRSTVSYLPVTHTS